MGAFENFAVSAGGSVVNSFLGNSFSRERDVFNSEQAQLNRYWQERMMNYNNWYNSPLHQLELYQQAGINPALLSGESFVPSQSGSGSMAQSTGVYTPFDIGAALESSYSSEVNKQNAETIDQLRTGQVRLQGLEFDLGQTSMRFSEKQMEEMAANINRINEECIQLRASVDKLKSEKEGQDILNSINRKIDARKYEEIDLNLKYTKASTWKALQEIEAAKALASLYTYQGKNEAISLFVNKSSAFSDIRSRRMMPVRLSLENSRLRIDNDFQGLVNDRYRVENSLQASGVYQWINTSLDFLERGISIVNDAADIRTKFFGSRSKSSPSPYKSSSSSFSF